MIILFGENGQVGRELRAAAAACGIPCHSISSREGNFSDPNRIASLLADCPANSFVINAAAYTQIDHAEHEREAAMQINGRTPGVIARICQQRGFKLIHLSANDVFAGNQQRGYREHEFTGPLGVYGESKLLGERLVLENLDQAIVLRTAWVFSAHGQNFVKSLIQQGTECDAVSVVDDQVGGPTSAASIASTCLELVKKTAHLSPTSDLWGVYHYCGKPSTSLDAFAREIFRQTGQNVVVDSIQANSKSNSARRPANAVLACGKIMKNFEIQQPDWVRDLSDVVAKLGFRDRSSVERIRPSGESPVLQEAQV